MKEFKALDRFGNEHIFEIVDHTTKEENDAEIQYRIAYTHALKAGLLTRESMIQIMKDSGSWTIDYENRLKEVTNKCGSIEAKLELAILSGNSKEAMDFAQELTSIRSELWELIKIKTSPLINSCEGVAEVIKNEALIASCVHIKGQSKYWNSYKDYVIERDSNEKSTVASEMYECFAKYSENDRIAYINNLPEYKYIKGVLDDNKHKNRPIEDGKGAEEILDNAEKCKNDNSVS